MRDFKQYKVWQKSHRLTLSVYACTGSFPKTELYGLTSQMRRAGASIPTNIAEGCGRDSDADFARFLTIATGSASELEYQLILARDLKYLDSSTYGRLNEQTTEVKRMLTGLIKKLRAKS